MKDVTHRRLRANPLLDIGESKQTNKQTNQRDWEGRMIQLPQSQNDDGIIHGWFQTKEKLGDSCIVVFDPRQLFFVFE